MYYFLVASVQISLICCMSFAIFGNHLDYNIYVSEWYSLLLSKIIASCALHMMLYPEVGRSMQLMKYAVNHPEYFTHPAIAFAIPFTAHNINIVSEALNLFMLIFWSSVEYTIMYFVALEVLVEIPHIYMGSLLDDQLKDRLFEQNHELHIHNKGSKIKWSSRTWSNIINRFLYRAHRVLYVAVIFYF